MSAKRNHPLIYGTIILTATGFLTRIIGFFYRIYLSRLFGEEGMGIYQLLSPVLSLSFSLTAAGYQTAISKLVAEYAARTKRPSFRPLAAGLCFSFPLSVLCCIVVWRLADPIAAALLGEARCAPMLRILSLSIPFGAVHACANGFFYGMKKAGVPSASQLLEQLTRVGCVYLIAARCLAAGKTPSVSVAVVGLTVGEFFSMLISAGAAWNCFAKSRGRGKLPSLSDAGRSVTSLGKLCGQLLSMALPLTANRIVLNLLQSVESVSIPAKLRLYGYDNVTALSVYGVLTGMAMPFIFFPNAFTSAVAILLLPMISENYALGDINAVRRYTQRTVRYCVILGVACLCVFVLGGRFAGETLFHSSLAGYFITTLGFICPFLYLDTTLSSILQGLGKAGHIFVMNVVCLLIRLGFVFGAVPRFGIAGYLWGILAGQLALGILYLLCLWNFFRSESAPKSSP